jgi:hypothetical protein
MNQLVPEPVKVARRVPVATASAVVGGVPEYMSIKAFTPRSKRVVDIAVNRSTNLLITVVLNFRVPKLAASFRDIAWQLNATPADELSELTIAPPDDRPTEVSINGFDD